MFTFIFRTRRRLVNAAGGLMRCCCNVWCCLPRRNFTGSALSLTLLAVLATVGVLSLSSTHSTREEVLESRLVAMQVHLEFLNSQYHSRQEDILRLQRLIAESRAAARRHGGAPAHRNRTAAIAPDVAAILRNITGSFAALGMASENLTELRSPFLYHLMPHLLEDPRSLRPAYRMTSGKNFTANIVIGVPTVKRDKETYLMITLEHLVKSMSFNETTLIVVYIGETDLAYVMNTAYHIETAFPSQVAAGQIEVISPSSAYYPDLDALQPTLGDSAKRMKWRTKQNLDAIFLMAYAQPRGLYYLMLEDDVVAKKDYLMSIQNFIMSETKKNPNWILIDFCQVGGIGKLLRSSRINHFITYVQLFYASMPIDWLLESYLSDVVCGIDKTAKECQKDKLHVRPKYKTSLFQHIGLYSSLKGKIQKLKDPQYGALRLFYPNQNPAAELRSSIDPYLAHTLQKVYDGTDYFWGLNPKMGQTLDVWFEKPTHVKSFLFRSGNVEHVSDKFYDAVVEALPSKYAESETYVKVGTFDEFGLAEGELNKDLGPLAAIRIRVMKDSKNWIILSEIKIKTFEEAR